MKYAHPRLAPDHVFPILVRINGPLIMAPWYGNALQLVCLACDRERWVGGREICERHSQWLGRGIRDWAAPIRCEGCASIRLLIIGHRDPEADDASSPEDGSLARARRLQLWLRPADLDVRAFRHVLTDLPTDETLAAEGL